MAVDKTKALLEYHLKEFNDWLSRNGKTMSSQEKGKHKQRKKDLSQKTRKINLTKLIQTLNKKVDEFTDKLVKDPSIKEKNLVEFKKNLEGLYNHLRAVIHQKGVFSKEEKIALNTLEQTLSSELQKEAHYFPNKALSVHYPHPDQYNLKSITHLRKQESQFGQMKKALGEPPKWAPFKIAPGRPGAGRGTRNK